MNIPSFTFVKRISLFALVVLAMAVAVSAQTAEAAFDIDQCANGPASGAREACTGSNWVNGNLGESKSQYQENDSVAFRMVVTGLVPNSTGNVLVIGYDPTKAGKAAYDYLTTWNRTETGDPCSGVANCSLLESSTFPIPLDPRVEAGFDGIDGTSDDIVQIPGVFTCFGCTITAVGNYVLESGSYASDSTKSIAITFTAGADSTAVIAWGGHIASRLDWGPTNGAANISGSPYHMRNLTTGNQDRSLKVSERAFPAKLTIIKRIGDDESGVSNLFFGFDKSDVAGSPNFFLQDNNNNLDGALDRVTFDYPLNSGETATVSITELAVGFGWSLSGLQCVDSDGGLGFTNNSSPQPNAWDGLSTTATAVMQTAEFVTCTFENTQGTATAAPVSLGGTVKSTIGRPIYNATVTLMDTATGEIRTTLTDVTGSYRFDGVETTAFYALSVSAKKYNFRNTTQYFTLSEDKFDMNFVAN